MLDDLISIIDFDLMAGAEFIIIIGIVAIVSTITNFVVYKKYKEDKMLLHTASTDITGEDPVEEEMVMSWDGSLHRGFKDLVSLKSK
jgi:hypothetical protein